MAEREGFRKSEEEGRPSCRMAFNSLDSTLLVHDYHAGRKLSGDYAPRGYESTGGKGYFELAPEFKRTMFVEVIWGGRILDAARAGRRIGRSGFRRALEVGGGYSEAESYRG
jgi:hypothetical protein